MGRRIVICFDENPQVAFDRICLLAVKLWREPTAIITILRLRFFWINSLRYKYLQW
jgi:hypothetical protein